MSETEQNEISEEVPAEEPVQEQEPPPTYATGYHIFDKQQVRVQLYRPYMTGMSVVNGKQEIFGTDLLHGKLTIQRGEGEHMLLLLGMVQDDQEKEADILVTLNPDDVKHITLVTEVRHKSRLHTP